MNKYQWERLHERAISLLFLAVLILGAIWVVLHIYWFNTTPCVDVARWYRLADLPARCLRLKE